MKRVNPKEVDESFLHAVKELGWPDYVRSDVLLERCLQKVGNLASLRMNMKVVMQDMGYSLFPDPDRKDGRWVLDGKRVNVYKRNSARKLRPELIKENFVIFLSTASGGQNE